MRSEFHAVLMAALLVGGASYGDSTFTGLGDLPGGAFESWVSAISTDGSTVVGDSIGASGREAFRWTSEGGMVGLGDFSSGEFQSYSWGVSADGSTIVGEGTTASGARAFRWTSTGGMVGLGTLPGGAESRANGVSADGSVIVGTSDSWAGDEAIVWTSTFGMVGLGVLPGKDTSVGHSISADGSTVVGYSVGGAYRWTLDGGVEGLGGLPGSVISIAANTSADGSTVVGMGVSNDIAFIWDSTNGIRRLDTLLTDRGVDLTGWTLKSAFDISDDGLVIVGNGTNPSGDPEAWIAYLPESSTAALHGTALLTLLGLAVRRRSKAKGS